MRDEQGGYPGVGQEPEDVPAGATASEPESEIARGRDVIDRRPDIITRGEDVIDRSHETVTRGEDVIDRSRDTETRGVDVIDEGPREG